MHREEREREREMERKTEKKRERERARERKSSFGNKEFHQGIDRSGPRHIQGLGFHRKMVVIVT